MAATRANRKTAAGAAAGSGKKATGGHARNSAPSGSKAGNKSGKKPGNKTGRNATGRSKGPTVGDKSAGLTKEALRIVEQAASILEEEIAAGIVAAKRVEERYVNVNALRSGASEQVIQRFRKDAHEVLDILLDLVNLSVSALSGLGERALNIGGGADAVKKSRAKPGDAIPELVVAETLQAGESGTVGMLVENDGDQATGSLAFLAADLLGPAGARIGEAQVGFDPPALDIAAHEVGKVNVTVSIPEDAMPGRYCGLVLVPAMDMRAILTVHVEA